MATVISPQAPPSSSCSLCTRTPDRAYRAWTRTAGGQGGRTWVAPPCEARRSPTGAGCLQGHCLTRGALSSRPRDGYAPAHKIFCSPQGSPARGALRFVPACPGWLCCPPDASGGKEWSLTGGGRRAPYRSGTARYTGGAAGGVHLGISRVAAFGAGAAAVGITPWRALCLLRTIGADPRN
jgi:hypothetical protein